MATQSGIKAGRAYVELGTNDSALQKGLAAAQKRVAAWGSAIAGMGLKLVAVEAVVKTALFGAAKAWAEQGAELASASVRTGVAVEDLSALAYAANQSGIDLDSLQKAIAKMSRELVKAANGSHEAQDAIGALGLNLDQMLKLPADKQLKMLAEALNAVVNPTERTAAAMAVFGRDGARLLPFLRKGAAGINALMVEAQRLGMTWTTAEATAAREFNLTLKATWAVIMRTVGVIGSALVPIITQMATLIQKAGKAIADFIRENGSLVEGLWIAVSIVGAVGVGFIIFGKVLGLVGAVLAGFNILLGAFSALWAGAITVLAAIISPLGLIITSLVSLGAYLVYTSGVGTKALEWLGDSFDDLKGTALTAWQGIVDALAAGDIGLAVKIAGLTMKLFWTQAIGAMQDIWTRFVNFFADAWSGVRIAFSTVSSWIAEAWVGFTTDLQGAWVNFTAMFQRAWQRVSTWFLGMLSQLSTAAQSWWAQLRGLLAGDTTAQITAEVNRIEQAGAADLAALDTESGANIAAIDAEQEARIEAIRQDREARLGVIRDEQAAAQAAILAEVAARERARRAEAAGIEAEIAAARTELAAAALAAAAARRAAPGRVRGADALPDLDAVSRRVEVAGTFSASAARGLGQGGGELGRTANATEETARNTRELIDLLRRGQGGLTGLGVFG